MNMSVRIAQATGVTSTHAEQLWFNLCTTINAFREAQRTTHSEMRRLGGAKPLDREALLHLGTQAHVLANQAEDLILSMVKAGTPEAFVALVDEIFDSFRDAEAQIETALKRRRP